MSLEIGHSLKLCCDVITKKCERKELAYRYDFMELLGSLNAIEKYLVAKFFCTSAWNIGSLRVLDVLQELRLLTATEFILSLQDAEQIQLILNDFLEAEYSLLSNLFISAHYDSLNAIRLNTILDEGIGRLFMDLLKDPTLNSLNYLEAMKGTLPNDLLQKMIQKHISITLELHSSNVKSAFLNFSKWINEGADKIQFTQDLYDKLICLNVPEALNYLFKLSTMEHFKEWKFYLILLRTIASKCAPEHGTLIRKYLKTRLRQIATLPNKNALLHLLLTTRASTAITMDIHKNLCAYADWYKQNIGEMKFVFKTEEFQNVLSLLEECISYEEEEDYLELHATITIAPPVYCGKLVHGYKSKCKMRLSQLKAIATPMEANETILIQDSD